MGWGIQPDTEKIILQNNDKLAAENEEAAAEEESGGDILPDAAEKSETRPEETETDIYGNLDDTASIIYMDTQ